MVKDPDAARAFSALGNPTRLAIVRLLVRAGRSGLNVTEIRETLDVPASTLAHHLDALAGAGLLEQARTGRELVSTADFAAIRRLSAYLVKDCCAGVFRARASA